MSNPEKLPADNRWEGELRIPNPKEQLPDEILANLLASIATSEAKALTLIAMAQTEDWYTVSELYEEVMLIQGNIRGEGVAWKMSVSTPFGYCKESLEPIGLVVRGLKYNPNSEVEADAYQISEFGARIGVPFAGLMLDYSLQHPNFSLFQLFGKTQSSLKASNINTSLGMVEVKNRSPENRLRIFRTLAEVQIPLSVKYIAGTKNIDPGVIGRHLENLAESGIVNYKAAYPNKTFVAYTLCLPSPVANPPPFWKLTTLTSTTYTIIQDLNREGVIISPETVIERLRTTISDLSAKEVYLRSHIPSILKHLMKHGYLTKISEFDGETRSITFLSESQSELISELVAIIDAFQRQDSEILERGRNIAFDMIHNSDIVNQLMEKARKTSPHANKVYFLEWQTRILVLLATEPKGFTVKELRARLTKERKQISQNSIQKLLRQLSDKGYVYSVSNKSIYTWYAVSEVTDRIVFRELKEQQNNVVTLFEANVDTQDSLGGITKGMILEDPSLLPTLFNDNRVIIHQKGRKLSGLSRVMTCLEIGAKGWEISLDQKTGTQHFMKAGEKMQGKRYYFEPGTVTFP